MTTKKGRAKPRFAFYRPQEVWAYWDRDKIAHEVSISMYDGPIEHDHFVGEGSISWHSWGDGRGALRLEVFEDAWAILPEVTRVLKPLNGTNPSIERVCAVLREAGWVDRTAEMAAESSNPIPAKEV